MLDFPRLVLLFQICLKVTDEDNEMDAARFLPEAQDAPGADAAARWPPCTEPTGLLGSVGNRCRGRIDAKCQAGQILLERVVKLPGNPLSLLQHRQTPRLAPQAHVFDR